MADHRFDDDDDIYGSDDKNKKIKKLIFWLLQGILAVFFILISYSVSKIIFSDIFHLTLEKFPTIYLVIPFGIFLFLVLLDVLVVYAVKYIFSGKRMVSSSGDKEKWIQFKNWVILVTTHVSLGVLFLLISLGASFGVYYLIIRTGYELNFFIIIFVSILFFVSQVSLYIYSRRFTISSNQKGIKRSIESPRKVISEGLNFVWLLEDLILVPLGRFEIEDIKVEDIWTEPGKEECGRYIDETTGKEIIEYEDLRMQKIDVIVTVYTEFKTGEDDLFNFVRRGAPEILAIMKSNISDEEILRLEKFEKGDISKEEAAEILKSYRKRPLTSEQATRLIEIAIKKKYDSLIKGVVKDKASKMTYRKLNKERDVVSNQIGEDLRKDETFKKSGLDDNTQIKIIQIILPKEVEDAERGIEVAKKNAQSTAITAEGAANATRISAVAEAFKANTQADSRQYDRVKQGDADLIVLGLKDPKTGEIKPEKEDKAIRVIVMKETLGALKETDLKIIDAEGTSNVFERIVNGIFDKITSTKK